LQSVDKSNSLKLYKGPEMLKWILIVMALTATPAKAATYVLVHGAWGSIHAYDGTADILRAAGHKVYVAALAGLGTRENDASPSITLSSHVNDVQEVIDRHRLKNIILVGHSYGGMIITAVASRRASRISSLVYIDAFLPRDGDALWDIVTEEERKHFIDAQRDRPGLVKPFPGAPKTLSRQPLLTLMEPVHLTGDEARVKRRSYIYATRGAPATFKKFYDRVAADPAWKSYSVESGHVVMQDAPDALNAILLEEGKS
jgi:pimeloyl-ACP methyl ester carboxylesterase